MNRKPPTKKQAIAAGKKLRELLLKKNFPVKHVLLFGSVAKGTAHPWSDIDIAVIHEPFATSKLVRSFAMVKCAR